MRQLMSNSRPVVACGGRCTTQLVDESRAIALRPGDSAA